MKQYVQRFISKRITVILFITLLFAGYFQLLQSSGDGNQSVVYEQKTLMTKSGCHVVESGCPAYGDNLDVFFKIIGNPGTLKAFPVELNIDSRSGQNIQKVFISFTMKNMSMGKQQFKLSQDKKTSKWTGKVILPICSTGRKDWHIRVDILDASIIYVAGFNVAI